MGVWGKTAFFLLGFTVYPNFHAPRESLWSHDLQAWETLWDFGEGRCQPVKFAFSSGAALGQQAWERRKEALTLRSSRLCLSAGWKSDTGLWKCVLGEGARKGATLEKLYISPHDSCLLFGQIIWGENKKAVVCFMPSHKNMEPSWPQLGANSWSQAFVMIRPLVLQIEVMQKAPTVPGAPLAGRGHLTHS